MGMKKDSYDYILYLTLAFLVGGFIHVLLYNVPFTDSITQVWYGIVVVLWGGTIRNRVVDKRLSRCCNAMVFLLFLNLIFQITKYSFVDFEPAWALRYLEYLYYLPLIYLPAVFLVMALIMVEDDIHAINRKVVCLLASVTIIIAMVMTNDIHHWYADVYIKGQRNIYDHNWLFYGVYVVNVLLIFCSASLLIRLNGYAFDRKSKKRFFSMIRFCVLIIAFFCLQLLPKVGGARIWTSPDINEFLFMLIIEIFIHKGYIPANSGYFRIFSKLSIPIKIVDKNGIDVIKTEYPMISNENKQLYSMPIPGGEVHWIVDLTEINQINAGIEELSLQIENRNEYLREAIRIKEEQAKVDAQNELYDRIADIVRTQINEIQRLIKENFDSNLPSIAILNAYIKRRSNMELLRTGTDTLTLLELHTALKESCEYINLSKINTMVTCNGSGEICADLVVLAYEFFENIVEKNLQTLKAIAVFIKNKNDTFSIRLMIQADAFEMDSNWQSEAIHRNGGSIHVSGDSNDYICSLAFVSSGKESTDD